MRILLITCFLIVTMRCGSAADTNSLYYSTAGELRGSGLQSFNLTEDEVQLNATFPRTEAPLTFSWKGCTQSGGDVTGDGQFRIRLLTTDGKYVGMSEYANIATTAHSSLTNRADTIGIVSGYPKSLEILGRGFSSTSTNMLQTIIQCTISASRSSKVVTMITLRNHPPAYFKIQPEQTIYRLMCTLGRDCTVNVGIQFTVNLGGRVSMDWPVVAGVQYISDNGGITNEKTENMLVSAGVTSQVKEKLILSSLGGAGEQDYVINVTVRMS